MVTRDYVLNRHRNLVLNVADTSNLKRSLYHHVPLLEMGAPLIVTLNMDGPVAEDTASRGGACARGVIGRARGGTRGEPEPGDGPYGKRFPRGVKDPPRSCEYGSLEPFSKKPKKAARTSSGESYPWRWIAVKLFEEDEAVRRTIVDAGETGLALLERLIARASTSKWRRRGFPSHIGLARHTCATALNRRVSRVPFPPEKPGRNGSDAGGVNRFLGPLLLLGNHLSTLRILHRPGYKNKLTEYLSPGSTVCASHRGTLPPRLSGEHPSFGSSLWFS
jgi:ferrous iron transport protein B